MWLIVMFDLPVQTNAERKKAARFRNDLLDLGFQMSQYSVYMKFCGNRAVADALSKKVERIHPGTGVTSILRMTDKQMEDMIIVMGKQHDNAPDPDRPQLILL